MNANPVFIAGFLGVCALLWAADALRGRGDADARPFLRLFLLAFAAANLAFLGVLFANHVNFPLNLDLMEGTVLQHYRQAFAGEPVYPEPSLAYFPLAYNPLYYVISIPMGWVFGANLFTLRLMSILAALLSAALIFKVTREKTGSLQWALIAAGLFAAAYRVMDAYLDTAHSDAWFLLAALLGTYLIDRYPTMAGSIAGTLTLVAAFWFKQHGALFAIGGVLFVTWRDGFKKALPCWILAALLGPGLYLFAGPWLFGSHFHYFTWEVPSSWSTLGLGTVKRFVKFIGMNYAVLAAASAALVVLVAWRRRSGMSAWHWQWGFALASGFMGTLDYGSSNNVYIPMGTWFILVGTWALSEWSARPAPRRIPRPHLAALAAAFAAFLYNPSEVIVSPKAHETFEDFTATLGELDGPVYAPWLGQLDAGYALYPAAHWVALEDTVRGSLDDIQTIENHPEIREWLEPFLSPKGPVYLVSNYPIDSSIRMLRFLDGYFELQEDWGDRFKPLRVLPKRWDHGWPRYLYRIRPERVRDGAPAISTATAANPATDASGGR